MFTAEDFSQSKLILIAAHDFLMRLRYTLEILHDEEFIITVNEIIIEGPEIAISAIDKLIYHQTYHFVGVVLIPCRVCAGHVIGEYIFCPQAEDYAVVIWSPPTASRISTLAPSMVPRVMAPFIMNFMLPVPEASFDAVEICSETSAAG